MWTGWGYSHKCHSRSGALSGCLGKEMWSVAVERIKEVQKEWGLVMEGFVRDSELAM